MKFLFAAICLIFIPFGYTQAQIITPGTTTLCVSTTMNLSDMSGGGTWSSSNTAVALVGLGSGIVTGVSTGTVTVSYTVGASTSTVLLTVDPKPYAMRGITSICVGGLSGLVDSSGTVWTSSNTAVAVLDSSILIGAGRVLVYVTGVGPGTSVITFTTMAGCRVTETITVNALPPAIVTPSFVCLGTTVQLSDSTPGGIWFSTNDTLASIDSATGLLTGKSGGFVTIGYMLGDYSCSVSTGITVKGKPDAGFLSSDTVCIGHPVPWSDYSADAVSWTSSDTTLAMVDTFGVTATINGLSPGTVTISMAAVNSCGAKDSAVSVTVLDCDNKVADPQVNVPALLKLEPNPNSGSFSVTVAGNANEMVRLVITDLTGQKVREFMTLANHVTEVKMDCPAGIYLLSAFAKDGYHTARLIVE